MTLLRRRAARRSCLVHGDNGCEIQGEAGPRGRALDRRRWRDDITDDAHLAADTSLPDTEDEEQA